MSDQSYTPSFSVGRTPDEIFDAITNIHGWWKAKLS